MIRGAIVTNGGYTNAAQEHQVARLIEAAERRGAALTEYKNDFPIASDTDFPWELAIFLDKDLAFAERLKLRGVAVYNSPESIAVADDKAATALVLEAGGVKIPKTVAAPKRYRAPEGREYLERVFRLFGGRPVIVKERESSLGMGVYRAETAEELCGIVRKIGVTPHLFQEEMTESLGKSVRVYVAGKKVVGAIALSNQRDFRSNAAVGGVAEAYLPTEEERKTAIRAAELTGLLYAGVDLFRLKTPTVVEVNSNAYFKAFEQVTGIDAAGAVTDAILAEYLRSGRSEPRRLK